MQTNFTQRKVRTFLKFLVLPAFLFCLASGQVKSQIITLSTQTDPTYNGLNTFGAVNSAVTFVIQNTNGFPVTLTGVDCYFNPGAIGSTSTVPTLWYSTTSLSGAPTIAGPTWTSLATGPIVNFPAAGYYNVLNGLSFSIPAASSVRFALQGSTGLSYSGGGTGVPAINTFSSNGVNMQVGNVLIGGLNVGYAGSFPSPTFNPRHFTGRVTIDVSTTPCTGTPAPGNTLSSVNPVCPGINFNLSLQNSTTGSGVTYQWQSAPAVGGPWTNIGASSPTLSTNQVAATFYRCTVTCGANSGTSTPLQVNMAPVTSCYCTAGATSTAFEKISNVTYGTINNNSTSTAGYENFTALSTTVVQGQTSPISVSISTAFSSDQVRVWIDFNQDGDFIDVGEAVYVSAQGVGPHVGNITIPLTASVGTTRMRVRMHDAALGPNNTPCGTSTYGQVEDYSVNIQPCVQGVFTTNPSSTSIQCSSNASFTVVAAGSALTYQWQYRVTAASPWLTVPNAAPYSGVNTTTLTLTNAPQTLNGYQYRAVMQGPCTAVDFSGVATLTVTPLIATVTPTAATICTGTIQQLSLTNASSPTTVSFNNNTPLAIPDGVAAGVQSTIAVAGIPAGAIVSNISVRFSIPAHTWVGDLDINLIAPNNVNMNLVGGLDNGTGSNSTDGFLNTVISSTSVGVISGAPAPRTGTYAAERRNGYGPTGNTQTSAATNWANLQTTLNGNWRLAIADFFGGDVGTLTDWTITITYGAPAAGVWTASPAAPNTMFTDALATVPYVAGTPVNTIYVNPTVNTNYTVVYTTATPCTSNPTVIPVSVVNPVSAVVNPTNKSVCVGGSTTFTTSAAGGPLTYQWQVSTDAGLTWTNISGATSSSLTLTGILQSMNGYRYRAVLTAAPCAGSTNTGSATLTVNALPTVTISSPDLSITPGQTTTITATSSPAAATANSWSWTLDGSSLTGTTNTRVVGIDGLGTYQATVTDINGCVNSSNSLTIGAEASDRLWIYPNPSEGAFQVRLYYAGPVTEKRVVSIFKSNGQLVGSKEFTLDNVTSPYLRMDFDLGSLAAGTYVVKVHNTYTNKVVSGLVVIQH